MKDILIIDDDIHIGNMLEDALTREGYGVYRAYSGTEAVLFLSNTRPDIILLDLVLPGLSGEEVLPKISGVPVIVISAKADVEDKVKLLLGGAVDYVTKPFQIRELLARISVHLRNNGEVGTPHVLRFEDLKLDSDTHIVTACGNTVKLTRTEYAILKLLMQGGSQIITKSQLLDRICEDTPDCTESSLKTHISPLRGKLRDACGREYIEAVWGIGFRLTKYK